MRFTIKIDRGREALEGVHKNLRNAYLGAITDAGDEAKRIGRQNIAASGFGKGWQNTLRTKVYPNSKKVINMAVVIYHKIPFSGVFEEPTQVNARGKYMWLPIYGVKLGSSIKGAITPKLWEQTYGKLVPVMGPSGPLLVTAEKNNILKKGTPVFFGVTSIQQRKQFNIAGATKAAADKLPEFIVRRMAQTNG